MSPCPRQNLASTSWAQHVPTQSRCRCASPRLPQAWPQGTLWRRGRASCVRGTSCRAWLSKKGGRGSSRAGFTETHSCPSGRLRGVSGAGVLCGAVPDGDLYPALTRAGVPSSGRGCAWGEGTPHKGHNRAPPQLGNPSLRPGSLGGAHNGLPVASTTRRRVLRLPQDGSDGCPGPPVPHPRQPCKVGPFIPRH